MRGRGRRGRRLAAGSALTAATTAVGGGGTGRRATGTCGHRRVRSTLGAIAATPATAPTAAATLALPAGLALGTGSSALGRTLARRTTGDELAGGCQVVALFVLALLTLLALEVGL